MTLSSDPNTEELLQRVDRGDQSALGKLLARHRDRLRRMVAVRMDPRMTRRIDPSDVVQEALAEASRKLPDFLRERPLPFYPWLRQIAWERLVHLHYRHVEAARRTVTRERQGELNLPDGSVLELAGRLKDSGTSPSGRLVRKEVCSRVRVALEKLAPHDRDVLVLRYVEQLSSAEAAAVLGISETAAKTRHFRAVRRLHELLGDDLRE